jgi:hypothetical protein
VFFKNLKTCNFLMSEDLNVTDQPLTLQVPPKGVGVPKGQLVPLCKTLTTLVNQLTQQLEKERSNKKRCREPIPIVNCKGDLLIQITKFVNSMEINQGNEDVVKCHSKFQNVLHTLLDYGASQEEEEEEDQDKFDRHLSRVEVLFGETLDLITQDDLKGSFGQGTPLEPPIRKKLKERGEGAPLEPLIREKPKEINTTL